jgi:hypothetical protein
MSSTFAPVCARLIAMFVAVVVFPSLGMLDVTSSVLGACPAVESSTDVRRCRYTSVSGELAGASISNSGDV